MPEFTQEQIDAMIAQKVTEARAGLFNEEELTKRVTSEVDRRVESGIQKGLETQKQKWEREFTERANMTAEQLAQKAIEEQSKNLTAKELEIKRRANRLEAKDLLSTADIPKSHYDKFMDLLVSDDEEITKANVGNFISMFNNTKTEIETKVKTELSRIPPPETGKGDSVPTKDDFNKMGYAQKLKLKTEQPELYNQLIRN